MRSCIFSWIAYFSCRVIKGKVSSWAIRRIEDSGGCCNSVSERTTVVVIKILHIACESAKYLFSGSKLCSFNVSNSRLTILNHSVVAVRNYFNLNLARRWLSIGEQVRCLNRWEIIWQPDIESDVVWSKISVWRWRDWKSTSRGIQRN